MKNIFITLQHKVLYFIVMNKQLDDIKAIREMMEKSTKFLSLSGLSGIVAGVTAVLGAAFAYFYLLRDPSLTGYTKTQEICILFADAIVVLSVSLGAGVFFSWKKAKKVNQKMWNKITRLLVYNMGVPLVTGGIFCLIFLLRGEVEVVTAATLIFYGLALVNASKYTFGEVHYLGLTEIILGLLAAVFTHNGILFWTAGFGICHIIYGYVMYVKYDKKKE